MSYRIVVTELEFLQHKIYVPKQLYRRYRICTRKKTWRLPSAFALFFTQRIVEYKRSQGAMSTMKSNVKSTAPWAEFPADFDEPDGMDALAAPDLNVDAGDVVSAIIERYRN